MEIKELIGTMIARPSVDEVLQDFRVRSVDTGFGRPLGAYWWGIDSDGKRFEVPFDSYRFKKDCFTG